MLYFVFLDQYLNIFEYIDENRRKRRRGDFSCVSDASIKSNAIPILLICLMVANYGFPFLCGLFWYVELCFYRLVLEINYIGNDNIL